MRIPDIEHNRPCNLTYNLDQHYVDRHSCPIFGRNGLFTYNKYVGLLRCDSDSGFQKIFKCICCGAEEYIGSAELIFNTTEARRKFVSE